MDDSTNDPIVIKSNVKSVLFINLLKLVIGVVFLIVLLSIIGFMGQKSISEVIGFVLGDISFSGVYLNAVILLVLGLIFLVSLSTLKINKMGCDLYEDKLVLTRTKNLFFLSRTEVPYNNIIRVNVESKDFLSKIFKTANIVFELTGSASKQEKIESIKNPEQAAQTIQQKVTEHKMRNQAAYDEHQKIDNIFDKEGY